MSARARTHAAGALLSVLLLTLIVAAVRPSAGQEGTPAGDLAPATVAVELPASTPDALAPAALSAEYLSDATEAPRPFSHLLVRRVASVPRGASLTLFVRVSANGSDWTRWEELLPNEDLYVATDGPEVMWSQVVDVGAVARFWQVRAVQAAAPDGTLPTLRRFEVSTVDALAGPVAPAPDPLAPQSLGRPNILSRTAWGNPDGQGSRARPDYYPVNHIIVHHTAEANPLNPGSVNWAARVRAIWSFHAVTRGWGDIGYNFLIDPNGVIYEGRAGGDNAVGFHDTANYGSVGISMMGTFTSVQPAPATLDSLVRLMAWKAEQRDIDPLGRSYYYGCTTSRFCRDRVAGAIVPNIAGHRQVTPGHTTCPGDATMVLMPELRNRVKQLIESGMTGGGPGDNGDLQIDELESSFARSQATWYSAECGAGGHTFYTFATNLQSQSTNSATWRPNIPERARYRVFAHVPRGCGPGQATANAVYRIASADGAFERRVDQSASDGWVDLGAYTFTAGTAGAVELYDLTGEPLSAGRVVFFDAVRWVKEDAQTSLALAALRYDRTTLAAGELLKVTFVVENRGQSTVFGQAPRADAAMPQEAHVYDEAECFAGNLAGSSPAFLKETDRVRVSLGVAGWDTAHGGQCAAGTSDNPWRWGLSEPLAPGGRQEVVGYVRFRTPGSYTLRGGVIQEYVRYHVEQFAPTAITVTPERNAPDAAAYDGQLRPLAQVYRLGEGPDSLLARSLPYPVVPRGALVGSIPFDGTLTDWGEGGPLGLTDRFLVEQTRAFLAPVSGEYTFRTTTDDGSWLLVNGRPVVANGGLHQLGEAEGAVRLEAGIHTLAFIYFERGGAAAAGYDVRLPGAASFTTVIDGTGGGAMLRGGAFAEEPDLAIGADDRAGSGVASIRWRWGAGEWRETPGALLRLSDVPSGTHRLEYQAIDLAGNIGPARELAFRVDTSLVSHRVYVPMAGR